MSHFESEITSAAPAMLQSPGTSTLSSWIDLIDELIELPPESTFSSSPTDPTSSVSLSPSSSSSFESLKRQRVKECNDHQANLNLQRQAATFLQQHSNPVMFPAGAQFHQFKPAAISLPISNPQPIPQRSTPPNFASDYGRFSPKQPIFYDHDDTTMFDKSVLQYQAHSFPSTTHVPPPPDMDSSVFSMQSNVALPMQDKPTKQQHAARANMARSIKVLTRSLSDELQANGLRLVHLLLACAEAVSSDDYIAAKDLLLQLLRTANINGNSMERVAAYFTNALHSRLTGADQRSYNTTLKAFNTQSYREMLIAYQILYEACPYIKFSHFSCNQAIFEAFEGEESVHIIDLNIMEGYQWPAFIQVLAARAGGAPNLRITGVGLPLEAVHETGKRLSELAESLHVPFEFHAVGERLENLKPHMLQRRIGEALAVNSVNSLHRLLTIDHQGRAAIVPFLQIIREQGPSIFTIVEQEANHNGHLFLCRFLEALHYYSAIFDSLDATLPRTSAERSKVEQEMFGQEITNIVACEGFERIERHQKLEKWRPLMEGTGFEGVPLSATAVNQARLILGLYPCNGYTLEEENGCLLLGWQDRAIIAASAWRC